MYRECVCIAVLLLRSVAVLAYDDGQQHEDFDFGDQQHMDDLNQMMMPDALDSQSVVHVVKQTHRTRSAESHPADLQELFGDHSHHRRGLEPEPPDETWDHAQGYVDSPSEADQMAGDLAHEMQADPHYQHRKSWTGSKSSKHFTLGSCSTRLTTPMNSLLKCSTYSGCQATCMRGHTFPSGDSQIFFVCEDGKWKVRGSSDDSIPHCKPVCIPTCQHGGSCVSPNTCDCPESYSGPYCQYQHKRCVGFPPTPNNARKMCNSESCTITCLDKHQFPDGSAIANVFCKEGEWAPARPDWPTIPDCRPVCIPECQNGGACMAFNMCNCPQQFRGPYCQYSVDVCDFRKLNFNGNYNCSESGGVYYCSLSCPSGMDFQSPPAPTYSCAYSEGQYNPATVPQCVFGGEGEGTNLEPVFGQEGVSETEIMTKYKTHRKLKTSDLSVGYTDLINSLYVLERKTPTAGVCYAWAGYHYRTFDGRVLSFKSGCTYTLASDVVDNSFQVLSSAYNCTARLCRLQLSVYVGDKQYRLSLNEGGLPVVEWAGREWPVPNQLSDLRTEITGHAVVATLRSIPLSLRWNLQDNVEVRVSEALWNRTGGLCGRMDGHATNDLSAQQDSVVAFANTWQANPTSTEGERCEEGVEEDACVDSAEQQAAHQFCNRLMVDKRFDACRKILPTRQYYEACRWDHCSCKDLDQQACACRSIAMFVRDCLQRGERSVENWRDQDNCPVECSGGRVYQACGPASVPTCNTDEATLTATTSAEECEEGCYCPAGMRLHEGRCIARDQCPCYLRAKAFPHGHTVAQDCNTCECVGGQWQCTDAVCAARCAAVGDPHYTTFDGRRYNFMGHCSYTLLATDNYTVEAENIACDGSISQGMGLGSGEGSPSCTKAVTLRLGGQVVRLKQNREISVDNEDVDSLPLSLAHGAYLRLASSMFIQVELTDGLEVWWDGQTRVYITAPPTLRGKLKGLCGTFNGNQQDDFLTPEGDIEQDPTAFADKWRTSEECEGSELSSVVSHPCDRRPQRRAVAESHCANITSTLFADCHFLVDPAPFYDDCLYDMCACRGPVAQCLCPAIAAYAKACSLQGATIQWRDKVHMCGVHCPSGQQYEVCGSTCARSCTDLSRPCPRHWACVEGCYCPPGQTLDAKGDCVPVAVCPCLQNGMEYPASHKEIRPGTKALQFCECKNAVWECAPATPQQITDYPQTSLGLSASCSATRHQEFTHCLPTHPITCKNMHSGGGGPGPTVCRVGCVCRRGYVLDVVSGECVRPAQCPCHHGGRSYPDGHKIQEQCNTCTCEGGAWTCTQHQCPAICTAWGDSHFRTFDSRFYDFQGACDYVLAKGSLSDSDSFYIALEIVPCGSSGVSCPKAVTLTVGAGDSVETLTFSPNKPLPALATLNRIRVRQAGLFVFAEVADLGLVLQWDRGTRIMLTADPKWMTRLKGLCGNYNGDEKDDFQTPSGGVSEVSAQLFGDSWRLQQYCPRAWPVTDTCKVHPIRKTWAVKKCGILKSSVFKPCHSEVPIEPYIDRCIFDACGCDQGGDCECLCTALAAYAQECNAHGVHIRWRSQQLCPLQCDETCSQYKPCVSTCPVQTCDNLLIHQSLSTLCQQHTCVEGCEMKECSAGQVYSNLTQPECVSVAECRPVCLTLDGRDYYEGDLIESDDCHSCYCSRHKKTCTGQPCTSPATPTAATAPNAEPMKCVSGWSPWINHDRPKPGQTTEEETIPTPWQFEQLSNSVHTVLNGSVGGQCMPEKMTDIECRSAVTGEHYKTTGEDVECTLEHGLKCRAPCQDYEIRVLCQCVPVTTVSTTSTTETPTTTVMTTTTTSTTPKPVVVEVCYVEQPLQAHPTVCSRYYQCAETERGLERLERECAPMLWFHPQTLGCDWPHNVGPLRPECSHYEEFPSEPGRCVDEWSEWVNGSLAIAADLLSHCPSAHGHVKDIECQYRAPAPAKIMKKGAKKNAKKGKEWVWRDHRDSDTGVVCSVATGLVCDNQCDQYRARVLCACDKKDEEHVVEKVSTAKPTTPATAEGCRSDERWVACDLRCDQLCLYYDHVLEVSGTCTTGRKCVPGCFPAGGSSECPAGFRWRDWGSCVRVSDCTCRSHTGAIVKPGEVVHESDCEVCICENNHYTCDDSACHTPTPATESPTTPTPIVTEPSTPTAVIIVPTTITPPPPCLLDRVPLEASGLWASSSAAGHGAEAARTGGAGWQPQQSVGRQHLAVDLGRPQALYAVLTAGTRSHYVSAYQLAYSMDNVTYSYVTAPGTPDTPKVFRGGLAGEALETELPRPVEARYVMVTPVSWVGGINMRLELFGCGTLPTTTTTTTTTPVPTTLAPTTTEPTTPETTTPVKTTPPPPVCVDDMGLDTGLLSPHQVTVSSARQSGFIGSQAALSTPVGWIPLLHSPSEWIQFDLTEDRLVTGVKTRGSAEAIDNMYEPAWVTSYRLTYSHDGHNWIMVLAPDHSEQTFLGNYDSSSVHTVYLDKPIHARFVRLYPLTWHNVPALRLELIGCYKPYLTTEGSTGSTVPPTTEPPTTTGRAECNVCEGAPPTSPCPCPADSWWDGDQCTNRTQCPCYVGHIPYAVGSTYDTEDCDQCLCSLSGQPRCAKKVCPPCQDKSLQAVLTASCGCVCKACPADTRLCPSANICLNTSAWCDGVVDCPDDELDCTTTSTSTTTTSTTTSTTTTTTTTARPTPTGEPRVSCPAVECPPGSSVQYINQTTEEAAEWNPFGTKSKWGTWFSGRSQTKGGVKGGRKGTKGTKGMPPHHKGRKTPAKIVCPQYKCVPDQPSEQCPPPTVCRDGYELKTVPGEGKCAEYRCEPVPVPDGKCNVTGRTFDTFDGTEYKYDICDHTLAQDMLSQQWSIKLKKTCPYVGPCSKALLITQPGHSAQLDQDLSVLYNGYSYTVQQMQKIGSQTRDFVIKQVSDKFIIFASALGFTVVWDSQGNVRLTVAGTWLGQVDGLCGFYDGVRDNDRRRSDGSLALTSVEFGDSWGLTDCETRVCPLHTQDQAWQACAAIKREPLSACEAGDKAVALCVESVCACLERNTSDLAACRCQALLDAVTACQAAQPSVDLYTWRRLNDCPVECPAPLVYRECYSRVCEPGCGDLLQDDPCPAAPAQCFPGCYCPDGLVRQSDQCVRPADCRDCVCDGFGKTRFVTFDRLDFSFSGNCTHVLAETVAHAHTPQFKLLATNGPCETALEETCVKSLTLLISEPSHMLLIKQSVLVDGETVSPPQDLGWAVLGLTASRHLTLAVPRLQLDLVFHGTDHGFSLRLPSHLYRDNTRGLCGICNNNQTDDLTMSNGEVTEDADTFGKSWKATDLPPVLGKEEQCSVTPKSNCTLPLPDDDFCAKLMDSAIFGRCHAVVDPEPFVTLCHDSWCRHNASGCRDLEPYASECQAAGICLAWRTPQLCPYTCPPGLRYEACGLGCQLTCDTVQLYRKSPDACPNPPAESCVCPENQVWKNSSCVEETRCQPCDVEGHYPGDTWTPDPCTTCTCQLSKSVQCQRTECSAVVCELGYQAVTAQGTETDCCPKKTCVPVAVKNCNSAVQPACGADQLLKVETLPDGCQQFVCQCLPPDQCPDLSDMIHFVEEPGMAVVVNTSGCCPRREEVCRLDTCPPPPACPPFKELVTRDTERCCLQYRCDPLKETCLYEMEFIDDTEGGERRRKPSERFMVAKKGGEKWSDGPCRECECVSAGWRAKCLVTQCPAPPADSQFVFQAVPQPQQCCPQHRPVACRIADKVYQEGDVFAPPDLDPCRNLTCIRSEGGQLTVHETVQTCDKECAQGWEYTEPVLSGRCCGECVPVACVVNGTAHPHGTTWQSPDNCTTYACDIVNKQVQVTMSEEQCPSVTDCAPDDLYRDGCCLKCRQTLRPANHSLCGPEPLSTELTMGLVRTVLPSHGSCQNYEPIPGFTECQGTCDSSTVYNQLSDHHDSQCQCCQPLQYAQLSVSLLCEDGYSMVKMVSVPSACGCEACSDGAGTTTAKPLRYVKA